MVVSRRILIPLAVVAVVLFFIANALGDKHHGFVGAVSNVTWVGFLLSFLLLIVLGVVALVQSRRAPAA